MPNTSHFLDRPSRHAPAAHSGDRAPLSDPPTETVQSQKCLGINYFAKQNCSEVETPPRDTPALSTINPPVNPPIVSRDICVGARPISDAQAFRMMGNGYRVKFLSPANQPEPYGLRTVRVLDDLKFRTAYVLCCATDQGRIDENSAMVRRGKVWVHGSIEIDRDVNWGEEGCFGAFHSRSAAQ